MSPARPARLLVVSPVGPLLVAYRDAGVESIRFLPPGGHPPAGTRDAPARGDGPGRRIAAELGEYFAGTRRAFTLPLAPAATPFQGRVRDALLEIPYGATRSYGEVARALGQPGGARAVGQANGRNPLPIVVPCHRVLAAGGAIGGYLGAWGEGAGVAVKRWLLEHERGGRAGR